MILYHVCREADKYDFSRGDIGVTNRSIPERFREYAKEGNKHLKHALVKYPDIIHYALVIGEEKYILSLEEKLRPSDGIGWNIVKGGGKPPVGKSTGPRPAIRGKGNYQFKGLFVTPAGTFTSSVAAAKANGLARTSLWRLCTNCREAPRGRPSGLSRGFYFVKVSSCWLS